MKEWKLYRVKTIATPDADWVTDQTALASIPYVELKQPRDGWALPLKVAFIGEWLNGSGAIVSAGLNTFDATPIIIRARKASGPDLLSGNAVADGAPLTGLETHKPFVFDELMPGDAFAVRIANDVRVGATYLRLLYAELY